MPKNIRQSVTLPARPNVVYRALMTSKGHAAFTGGAARIDAKIGGKFSVYDGYITGVNVELARDRRIVQAWRGSDWPKGAYSIATFELEPTRDGKTILTFTQTGVPDEFHADIKKGWKDFYWKPMALSMGSRAS
ncbi:MAG TPA: SRPBCC family protein [Bdellovibrionota bacterium]|nr:SRPBCC family protein [Bdellovibrionota bacterium]